MEHNQIVLSYENTSSGNYKFVKGKYILMLVPMTIEYTKTKEICSLGDVFKCFRVYSTDRLGRWTYKEPAYVRTISIFTGNKFEIAKKVNKNIAKEFNQRYRIITQDNYMPFILLKNINFKFLEF